MCYNARMKEGYGQRGTKVAPCCAESHINITRPVCSPPLGRPVDLGKPGWQGLLPCTEQSGQQRALKQAS